MNAMPAAMTRPLLDMLGARWRVGVPATAAAWDAASGIAGFALGDGTVALAHATWDGGPTLRRRAGGGAEVVPATAAAPPVARVRAHRNQCVSIAADPGAGFLSAGADGRIVRVAIDGTFDVVLHLDRSATSVAAGAGGWRACASGLTVRRLGATASQIDLPAPVTALSLEPSAARLAIGHQAGVTLWAGGAVPLHLDQASACRQLAWSQDGSALASVSAAGGLELWRSADWTASTTEYGGPVASVAAFAGGFAVGVGGCVWYTDPRGAPRLCGARNQSEVTRIACHPGKAVLAVGYGNGAVVLCQPGDTGLLMIRAAGEGAVAALAFAPSGDHLAIGTEGGEIAVLGLPGGLFRDSPRPQ